MIHNRLSTFFCKLALFAIVSFFVAPQANAINVSSALKATTPAEQATVSNKELVQSLDSLIVTLENNKQRQQLLIDLKDLRNGLAANQQQNNQAASLVKSLRGLVTNFTSNDPKENPLSFWKERLEQAKTELYNLLPDINELPTVLFNFSLIIFLWFFVGQLVIWLIKKFHTQYKFSLTLAEHPTIWNVLLFIIRQLTPWIIAFLVTLYSSAYLLPSDTPLLGRSVALLFTYSILGGGLFSAFCFICLSLLSGEHRWGALKILRHKAFKHLFTIGVMASIGDALASPQLILLLKSNLSIVLSTFSNVLAALFTGWFVIRFRRPIAHLIRNRSLAHRKKRKNSYEFLRFLSMVWYIPILMLVIASLLATLLSGDTSTALRKALLCATLLIIALVLTGLIQRHSTTLLAKTKRSQNTLYILRLLRFAYTILNCFVWLLFFDLSLRVWGSSLADFEQGAGHDLTVIIITLVITVLCTRFIWILVDTAIYRALTGIGRGMPSTRAQTMMPLIRNTALCIILVIATIVALANLGMNVTPLLAGAGVIGIAIGFGAQSLVADLITGLFIIVEDSLAIGDYVDVGNHKGTVEALTIRTVCLRDIDGIVHIVPFSEIKSIKNYSRELGYAIFRIAIAHEMNIDEAIKIVRHVAHEMRLDPLLQRDIWSPIEFQGVESFEAGNAILRARFKTAPLKQFEISRTFNLRLKRYLDQNGLDLGVPRSSIRIYNETPTPQNITE